MYKRQGLTAGDHNINQSIEILQKLHEEEPSSIVAAKIGFAYLQKNETNLACNYFNEAWVFDQYEPTALYHLSRIRAIQGKKDKAMNYLRRLAQVDGVEDRAAQLAKMLDINLENLEAVK